MQEVIWVLIIDRYLDRRNKMIIISKQQLYDFAEKMGISKKRIAEFIKYNITKKDNFKDQSKSTVGLWGVDNVNVKKG